MITITKLLKKRKTQVVLDNISCIIPKNKITALIGQSGAGKTTLLRCIVGLEDFQEGSIHVSSDTADKQNEKAAVGFVFQNYSLFSNLTVQENCIQPLMVVKRLNKEAAIAKASSVLNQLGIGHLAASYPAQLSGGQQQRAALARSVCMNPEVLVLDEPTSALDKANIRGLQECLQILINDGITILLTSQDRHFVKEIADTVVLLDQGKIVASITRQNGNLDDSSLIKSFLD